MKSPITKLALAVAGGALALMLVDALLAGFHLTLLFWRVGLADLLEAAVLGYAAWVARGAGWRLFAALFLPAFVIRYVNTMDEGALFLALPFSMVIGGLVVGLVNSSLVAGVVAWGMGKGRKAEGVETPTPPRRSLWAWLWRFAAGDFSYLVLYFAAGLCVIPFVRDFYSNFPMPPLGALLLMIIFRSSLYIAALLPILNMIPKRRHAALAAGLALAILGGAVPLLPDNPIMPPNVRFAHSIEIGVSNFLFGVVVALLFSGRPARAAAPTLVRGHAAAT